MKIRLNTLYLNNTPPTVLYEWLRRPKNYNRLKGVEIRVVGQKQIDSRSADFLGHICKAITI